MNDNYIKLKNSIPISQEWEAVGWSHDEMFSPLVYIHLQSGDQSRRERFNLSKKRFKDNSKLNSFDPENVFRLWQTIYPRFQKKKRKREQKEEARMMGESEIELSGSLKEKMKGGDF